MEWGRVSRSLTVPRTAVTSPGSPTGTTTAPHLPFCTPTIAMETNHLSLVHG